MTTRYKALIVLLEEETRDDDLEPVLNAITLIRGVHNVEPMPRRLVDAIWAALQK